MKKRFLSVVMSIMLLATTVLGLVGCGGGDYVYPENPNFSRRAIKIWDSNNPQKWNLECVHDPIMLQGEDDWYYVFGTDNYGEFGYQIRKSQDLVDWQYVGVAIKGFGYSHEVYANNAAESGPLHEVYTWISQPGNFDCTTLWAPEVFEAKNGGYYLYGSWTTCFGSKRSIIFMCYAENIAGPYTYVDTIVASGASACNAIDATVFYDAEGKLWLSYGSWSNGFAAIELNPETGLRMDGAGFDEICTDGEGNLVMNGNVQYAGSNFLQARSTEGSVIAYHEDVAVYTGDVNNYDETKWTTKDYYYAMGSKDSLSTTYNMRSWKSENPVSDYTSLQGKAGNKVSGSFSWRSDENDESIDYDYYCPGHNDMYTLSTGVNVIAYHNRVTFNSNLHDIFVSMYDFNSNGDLVISPNRYAGESVRTVTEKEIYSVPGSKGSYDMVEIGEDSSKKVYCTEGIQFKKDGTITGGTIASGSWKVYGDHYIYIKLGATEYYGCVFPAWIEKRDDDGVAHGGLTITALSTDGYALYFNSAF